MLFLRLGGWNDRVCVFWLRGGLVSTFGVVVTVSPGELMMCKSLIRNLRLVRGGRDTPIWLRFGE